MPQNEVEDTPEPCGYCEELTFQRIDSDPYCGFDCKRKDDNQEPRGGSSGSTFWGVQEDTVGVLVAVSVIVAFSIVLSTVIAVHGAPITESGTYSVDGESQHITSAHIADGSGLQPVVVNLSSAASEIGASKLHVYHGDEHQTMVSLHPFQTQAEIGGGYVPQQPGSTFRVVLTNGSNSVVESVTVTVSEQSTS